MSPALQSRPTLLITATALSVLNICVFFPGALNSDSAYQYAQSLSGRYTDWQPPIMSFVWRLVHIVVSGSWPLFVLHMLYYWSGLAFFSDGLLRIGRSKSAYLMLFSGVSPLILFYNREIITDVGLASSLLFIVGVLFWFAARQVKIGFFTIAMLAVVLAYAALVRSNAAFAAAPVLLCVAGARPQSLRPRWWLSCILVAGFLLPITIFCNREVIGATSDGAVQRLQIYDLVGIAEEGASDPVIQAVIRMDSDQVRRCYTPLFWDTILTGRCNRLWYSLPAPDTRERTRISLLWLKAIAAHPIAYTAHRLKHFNTGILFLVPPAPQCVAAPEAHACGRNVVALDYIVKSFFVWPVTWLAVAASLTVLLRHLPAGDASTFARILLTSALLYGLSYAFVGIATNVRYFYWVIVATQTAVVLKLDALCRLSRRQAALMVAPVGLVVILGYTFRLMNINALLLN